MVNIVLKQTDTFIKESMVVYGKKTIEDRAIPDNVDGLKPVQRRILWSLHQLGNRERFLKASRIIGYTMGNFHPHSDMAIFGAITTLVNLPTNLIDGQGNWGNPATGDKAAAPRYVEARMSKFASEVLLDKEYLNVMSYIPNYDNTSLEPVVLPAKLPTILLTGSYGIAVGVSTSYPIFSLNFIKKLSIAWLSGKPKTIAWMAKNVEFMFNESGNVLTPEADLKSLFTKGTCSVEFQAKHEINIKEKTLTILSNAAKLNMDNKAQAVLELPSIHSVMNQTSDTIKYTIKLKDSIPQNEVQGIALELLKKYYTQRVSFSTVTVDRQKSGDEVKADFGYTNIINIMDKWTKRRIELERRVLKKRIETFNIQLSKKRLLLRATKLIKGIAKELAKKGENKALVERIAKLLSTDTEGANYILSIPIKSLANAEQKQIRTDISNLSNAVVKTKKSLKSPHVDCVEFIKNLG